MSQIDALDSDRERAARGRRAGYMLHYNGKPTGLASSIDGWIAIAAKEPVIYATAEAAHRVAARTATYGAARGRRWIRTWFSVEPVRAAPDGV